MDHRDHLQRLKAAHHKVALLVTMDPVYAPIFERLEQEIATHEKEQDVIARARAIANQSAMV